MWDYRAKILSVHDGDTAKLLIDTGFRFATTQNIRLKGVFAPELKQTGGVETTAYFTSLVTQQNAKQLEWPWRVVTERLKNDTSEVTTLERYVATIYYIDDSSKSVNSLIEDFITSRGYPSGIGG